MQTLFTQIQEQIKTFNENAEACVNKGNKAAGARARKASNELTKLFKEFRKKSLEAGK